MDDQLLSFCQYTSVCHGQTDHQVVAKKIREYVYANSEKSLCCDLNLRPFIACALEMQRMAAAKIIEKPKTKTRPPAAN